MLAPRQFGRSSEPEESEAPKTGVKAATALLEPTCFGCLLLKGGAFLFDTLPRVATPQGWTFFGTCPIESD